MEIDFYDQFSPYTTVELLLIIRQSGQYQPEAVAAAHRLLQERDVSPEDQEETSRHLLQVASEKAVRSAKTEYYKDRTMDILEPVLSPRTDTDPAKWYRLFIIIYGVYYAWAFYKFVRDQIQFLRCERCSVDISVWGGAINLLYLTIILFLLLKNKRWGWILLTVGTISAIFTGLMQWYILFKYWHVLRRQLSAAIFVQLLPIATVAFLVKASIREYFGIHRLTSQRTYLAGIILGLLYCGMLMLI